MFVHSEQKRIVLVLSLSTYCTFQSEYICTRAASRTVLNQRPQKKIKSKNDMYVLRLIMFRA